MTCSLIPPSKGKNPMDTLRMVSESPRLKNSSLSSDLWQNLQAPELPTWGEDTHTPERGPSQRRRKTGYGKDPTTSEMEKSATGLRICKLYF